jgi:outer membrane receptor protein involved in Fe transport
MQLKLWTAVLMLSATALHGQLTRGFISGVVQDPSGAVIVDAKVKIVNVDTGQEREQMTNAAGLYRFAAVEPGTYRIEYSKAGFESKTIGGVQVSGTQEVVLNQTLAVGATTTTVEVVEAPAGVELAKATATIERKLDQRIVQSVPLTGATRDVNVLALLAPTANRAPGSTGIAVNGQRARNNNFLLDGTDNNDASVTLSSNRIIPEGVAEFQVQAQAYSAEFGRNTGAQIQVFTRSGTNRWSGEVFDYYRANWMEPVSLINKRAGVLKTPRFVQNQAGGLIGGPIIKNRTFFFSLIEANRRREAPDGRNSTAATIITPQGFADLARVPLGDGQTTAQRQAALNGIAFLRDQIHPRVANYTNLRTTPVNGVPIQIGTINLPLANPYDFWYTTHRIDHKLTDRDQLSYRLQIDKRNQPDVVSNLQFGSLFSGAQTILGQNHALSHTRTVTPSFINEFRASYVRRNLNFPENDPKTPTTTIAGLFTIGGLANFPQGRIQNTFQWQNVSTWLKGKHSLKFGADIRRLRLFNIAAFDSKGTWTFDSLQDFINNRPASLRQAINTATFDARQTTQFYFVQDDYKVNRDLTLNIGIRYEVNGIPFGFFGATDSQSLSVGVPGPTRMDKNNWAPRFGFAYSPSKGGKFLGDGQTVIRGGFGMAYDVLFFNILTVNASNYPRVVVSDRDRASVVGQWPNLLPPVSTAPRFDPYATYVNSPVDTQNPTTSFWSLSIQRQFARHYLFEIGYTGSRSYHGIRQGQGNPGILTAEQAETVRRTGNPNSIPGLVPSAAFPVSRREFPAYGSRVLIESTALGEYHGMYLKFDKRLSRGFAVGGNYTWSANFSDNDESLGVGAITNSSPQIPQDFKNYRNEWSRSAFDVPHRVAFYYSWDLPGIKRNPILRHATDGWKFNGFTDFQSGQPFTIRTGVDTAGTGTPAPHRPSYNPSGTITLDPVTGNYRTFTTPINGTGIVVTPLAANGIPLANSRAFPVGADNLGRNTFRGPGIQLTNLSVAKEFAITERWKVGIRADWINTFNTRNFGNPVSTMNSPIFGQNTTDPGGRTMLMSARIKF